MPKYATIIDLVEYHECSDEPVEIDLTPADACLSIPTGEHDKFVQKLNDLKHVGIDSAQPVAEGLNSIELKDRRKDEHVKSAAPESLLNQIKSLQNSTPAHDIAEDPGPEE